MTRSRATKTFGQLQSTFEALLPFIDGRSSINAEYESLRLSFFELKSEIEQNLGQYNPEERDFIYTAFSRVKQPSFGIAARRFRSRSIASQSRDSSVASDASAEMPGDESLTSDGGTKMAVDDLSNFVVERDARILEVKKKELDIKNRIEDDEEEFAEVQRKMDRHRQDEEAKLRKAIREKR